MPWLGPAAAAALVPPPCQIIIIIRLAKMRESNEQSTVAEASRDASEK